MSWARVLPRSFYDREPAEVARDLLGAVVEVTTADGLVALRLVETEAYAGEDDPASPAWRGPTPRTQVMFGPPGHAYVYFSYGMHWALNVVTGPEGHAGAVLLRSAQVVRGEDLARARRRPGTATTRLASGPANLAVALGLDGSWSGADVTRPSGALRVRVGTAVDDGDVVIGPRVGISRGMTTPWRFRVASNPHVSGPRRTGG